MAIEAERLLAIFEAKFDALDKALAKSRANAGVSFAGIEADGTRVENALSRIGARGTPGIDRAAKSIQNTRLQTSNLAAQLNDIGVQLAGGQSPFLIAIQQGTQINQALGSAGARGAVTALGGAFASLINPVGLATIAIITLGGAAIQYFASVFSGGEKSAETLQKEASLIQEVAAKWGDALPGIKAYAEERARLAAQANVQFAAQAVIEGSFEGARKGINDVRSDLGQLIDDLTTMGGKEADVGKLQAAFTILDGKVADQTATAEDAKVVQAALADIQVSTGIPAANALAEAFGNLAVAIGTASAAAEKARVDAAQAAQVLSPLGTVPPVFSGGGAFQDESQVQNDRANAAKSQFQIEQEKAARAARSPARQRLTADDKIDEDIQAIRDRTAALQQEASMIGLSFEEQQKRKVALDLEQTALKQLREEALKKGQTDVSAIQLSPQQVASINAVAEAYAQQAQQLKDAREEQALQRDVLQGAFSDLRSALDDGKLEWKDLGDIAINALDRIIDKIENDLIDAILQANGAASSGGSVGILGSLLGAIGLGGSGSSGGGGIPWADDTFRAGGGPVQAGKAYIVGEKRPEVFIPGQSGMIHASVPSVQSAGAGGASVISPVFAPTIHMDGGQGDSGEQVTSALKKFEKEFTGRVVKAIREAKTTGLMK
ncbi:phage tail length tape measure family protein [Mesorhizobium sp. M0715]|uniref:phage tail length tape measure family protein n=1 Tax=Mesorhizobium sp. M0715 TaxID=2956990 RepID=UPI00333768E5